MMTINDALLSIVATLTVQLDPDVKVSADPSAVPSTLPALVLGAPRLLWETGIVEPTAMEIPAALVVDAAPADRALPTLLDLVPQVAAAVDYTPGVVTVATPGTYGQAGAQQLPAYNLTIEVPLS